MNNFFLAIDPVAKGRPRFTRNGHAYTPQKTRHYENSVRVMARAKWRRSPLIGAITLRLVFLVKQPKKKVRDYPTCKPDLDNLVKAVKDALNSVVWNDDSQIVKLEAEKIYVQHGGATGVVVQVETLPAKGEK